MSGEGLEARPAFVDLAVIDLASAAERGALLGLLHPVTGEPLGVDVFVIGSDAPTYRKNLREMRDALAMKPEVEPTDPDTAAILNAARQAAASMTSWDRMGFEGQLVPFSREAAVRVMTARPWIADQVAFFRDRRINFFKP